jgi:hypothetical protein
VLPRSVASQRLQAIARRRPQIIESYCCLNHGELDSEVPTRVTAMVS